MLVLPRIAVVERPDPASALTTLAAEAAAEA
jgi:hypothetical protein